jgi:hypothetical protein
MSRCGISGGSIGGGKRHAVGPEPTSRLPMHHLMLFHVNSDMRLMLAGEDSRAVRHPCPPPMSAVLVAIVPRHGSSHV